MSDPTAEFFTSLGRRGHEPLLESGMGTIRFDVARDGGVDRWYLTIQRGDLRVFREDARCDCLVRADKRLFDDLVTGRTHLYTAWVRNEIRVSGDVRLARLMQGLLPGPPGASHPREFAKRGHRT